MGSHLQLLLRTTLSCIQQTSIIIMKVLVIVAMALVAIANGEECGQDPYAMSGCQIMKKGSQGKPDRSEMGAMILSVENIGCSLPSRGSRSELFQGLADMMQCVVDSCEGQQDKCMDDEMYSMVKMDVEDAILMMENMA